jgi:Tol biopolymer transport system component
LQVQCSGHGFSSAVWKSVTLRAERMTWHPDAATPMPLILHVMQADGSGLRTLLTPKAGGFTHLGSPEWSADGRQIALDMSNGSTTTSHVFVINADGSGLRDLGLGCMPSFSGDGKSLVFSQPGEGVVMMNADGSGRRVLEANAWGTQWSPDGKSIVYIQPGNITLFDVGTKRTRPLLVGDAASRYDLIYWNLGWSHDSRSVGFKARRREGKGDELAVVDINAPQSFHVLMTDAKAVAPDCTWSPDNQSLIVPIQISSVQGAQLHRVSRKQPGLPELLPAQPSHLKISGCDWSPDGKQIVFAGQELPKPREWTASTLDP